MCDEHFFIDIQKRFGHNLADPLELKNKNISNENEFDYRLYLGNEKKPNTKGCKDLISTLHKIFI